MGHPAHFASGASPIPLSRLPIPRHPEPALGELLECGPQVHPSLPERAAMECPTLREPRQGDIGYWGVGGRRLVSFLLGADDRCASLGRLRVDRPRRQVTNSTDAGS